MHSFTYFVKYTGTSKKKLISWKRSIFFVTHFRKWNPYIIYIHYTEWHISSLYFLKFWWLWLTDNENPKLEYYIRSIKKWYFKQKCQASESMLISIHSILGWASFCMNYSINAAWYEGNQPVALLRCNRSPGCFDSSLQVICIVGFCVSHLPLDDTP